MIKLKEILIKDLMISDSNRVSISVKDLPWTCLLYVKNSNIRDVLLPLISDILNVDAKKPKDYKSNNFKKVVLRTNKERAVTVIRNDDGKLIKTKNTRYPLWLTPTYIPSDRSSSCYFEEFIQKKVYKNSKEYFKHNTRTYLEEDVSKLNPTRKYALDEQIKKLGFDLLNKKRCDLSTEQRQVFMLLYSSLKSEGEILLIEEPELHLSPDVERDILTSMNKLAIFTPIIATTNSVLMGADREDSIVNIDL